MIHDVQTTSPGRLLIAETIAPLLTHLAIGTGPGNVPVNTGATGLVAEIGRALYLERFHVVEELYGPIVVGAGRYAPATGVTNLVYFRFRFQASEAQGAWSEVGLFGGDIAFITRGATVADGNQAGDDRANAQVLLGGSHTGAANHQITVTVTTGGASPVVSVVSSVYGAQSPVAVTLGSPATIGWGLSLTWTGGADGILTLGDQWVITATIDADSSTFASGGVYDPIGNPDGQVLQSGRLFTLAHLDPAETKGAVTVDVQLVVEVLNG